MFSQALRRRSPGGWRWPPRNGTRQRRRGSLTLVVLALILLIVQSFDQQACPMMPFHHCMMAASTGDAGSATMQDQHSPCCPLGKMANCTGISCTSFYIAAAHTPGMNTSFVRNDNRLQVADSDVIRSFSSNIFHPPRTNLS